MHPTALSLLLLSLLSAALPAQKGGGTTPPPDPAIAFVESGIKVMNADGTNVRTVVALARGEQASHPSWAPDGQQLAFCGVLGGLRGVFRVNVDGSDRQLLAPRTDSTLSRVDWSRLPAADGRHKIAFLDKVGSANDVFVVDTDGTHLQNLTASPENEMAADWNRDATGLYLNRSDTAAASYTFGLLGTVADSRGGLAASTYTVLLPSWVATGCRSAHASDQLLLQGCPRPVTPTNSGNMVWSVDAAVLPWTPELVFDAATQTLGVPAFSPDDLRMVTCRGGSGSSQGIFTANADGSAPVRIRSSGTLAAWRHN